MSVYISIVLVFEVATFIVVRDLLIINNYSPQCRWLAVDIFLAALRLGKYPPLATDTEVNSCFSLY